MYQSWQSHMSRSNDTCRFKAKQENRHICQGELKSGIQKQGTSISGPFFLLVSEHCTAPRESSIRYDRTTWASAFFAQGKHGRALLIKACEYGPIGALDAATSGNRHRGARNPPVLQRSPGWSAGPMGAAAGSPRAAGFLLTTGGIDVVYLMLRTCATRHLGVVCHVQYHGPSPSGANTTQTPHLHAQQQQSSSSWPIPECWGGGGGQTVRKSLQIDHLSNARPN